MIVKFWRFDKRDRARKVKEQQEPQVACRACHCCCALTMAKPTIANKLLQQQEKCFFSFNLFSILFYFILSF